MPQFTISVNDKKTVTKKKKAKRTKKAIKRVVAVDDTKKVREEIGELEKRRATIGKGFKGFIQKAAISREIYGKKQFLGSKEKLKGFRAATESVKARTELEKARSELEGYRKKTQVNFEGLGGLSSTPTKKINLEDLYK